MKTFSIILIIASFIFSTCISAKNEQQDTVPRLISHEELEELIEGNPEFLNRFYHHGWVFQPGEYYLLSDVIVYDYPGLDSGKIGHLNIHDKVFVIEDVHNQQSIDETTSCWYKIKYNNMEGYIFGGNIAVKTFICDIDGNGTMDYFQHRISWQAANYHIDTRKDIILFINNIKINAGLLYAHDKTTIGEKYFFNLCSFEQVNNDVYITLSKASPVSLERYIFAVNALGDISLIDVYKTGSFFENDEWVEYE